MRPRVVISFGLSVALVGCATHHTIRVDPPDHAALAAAAATLEGRRAAIELGTVWVPQAIDVRLRADSLRWMTRDGGPYVVAHSRVRTVTVRDRKRGMLEGVLVGAGVAVVASLVAAIYYHYEPPQDVWIPPEVAVGVGVGLASIPLGVLVGAIRGHPVVFHFR